MTTVDYVTYDLVNNSVWLVYKGGKTGKILKFGTQKQAYKKARELALKHKVFVFDKYYSKMITPKHAKKTTKKPKPRSSTGFDSLW